MSEYDDLYRGTPPFESGSETSKAAAESIRPTALQLREQVWRAIGGLGGATCDEVEAHLGLSHQTTSARIRELFLKGRITEFGERRKTRSGRHAVVWKVCL